MVTPSRSRATTSQLWLPRVARSLSVHAMGIHACVDSGKGAPNIRKDVADSEKFGARGTPIFFLGLTEPGSSQIKAVRVIRGAFPYATFQEAIDSLLASAN